MLRRPMSALLSRIHSASRRYLTFLDDRDESRDNGSNFESFPSRLHRFLDRKLGHYFPAVIFTFLLTFLIVFANLTNGKESPFRNINHNVIVANFSKIVTAENNRLKYSQELLKQYRNITSSYIDSNNSTTTHRPVRHHVGTEISFVAIAFFTVRIQNIHYMNM